MLGTANKNIGDAFLFVWKLPSDSERGERMFVDKVAVYMHAVLTQLVLIRVVGQQDCNFPMGDYAVRAFLK